MKFVDPEVYSIISFKSTSDWYNMLNGGFVRDSIALLRNADPDLVERVLRDKFPEDDRIATMIIKGLRDIDTIDVPFEAHKVAEKPGLLRHAYNRILDYFS